MKSESFHFEVASLSDPGRLRALNEDAAAVDREHGFAVVADGMGGHRAGNVASRLALDSVVERLRTRPRTLSPTPREWIEKIVADADSAIHKAALGQSRREGMGSTLALVLFHDQIAILAHVGDSRIYRLRDGRLELLTRDDSLLHDQVERGLIAAEDAVDSHNRHLVTQALGIGEEVTVHVHEEKLRSGDVYLLCTDGLNDLVDEKDIEVIIDSLKSNLPLTASHLGQLANDNGGYDNITVALVRVLNEAPPIKRRGWLSRLLDRLAS